MLRTTPLMLAAVFVGCGGDIYLPVPNPSQDVKIAIAERTPIAGTTPARVPNSQMTMHVWHGNAIGHSDFEQASVHPIAGDEWAVTIDLTPAGATKLEQLTRSNPGKSLVLVIDDVIIQIESVSGVGPLPYVVEWGLDEEEARDIARAVSGAPK